MSDVVVRPCEAPDLGAVVHLLNREISGGVAHFANEPVEVARMAAELDERGRHPWLVAELDGAVVGFAKASVWKERGSYAWTTEIGVYVHEDHRGAGVAVALYEALFPALRVAGFRTVLAGIALPNDPSVRLHERFGMTHVGTFPKIGFKHDAWRDVGYWSFHFEE